MNPSLQDSALAYLEEHNVLSLATWGSQGLWSAAVFYAQDGFTLFFLSSPESRHCLNIAENSEVSGTVQEDCRDWPEIKGMQCEGKARRLSGKEETRAMQCYGEKFPLLENIREAPIAIREAFSKTAFYKVTLDRLFFLDNSRGFAWRKAVHLPPARSV